MNTSTTVAGVQPALPASGRPQLDRRSGPLTALVFVGLLAAGLLFTGYSLVSDVEEAGARTMAWLPFILLGVALLIAAILWNLGTWWLGLPASSSHTLIGSIIGVGVANALMHGRDGTSGVDWSQATKVGYSLLLSPLVGFCCLRSGPSSRTARCTRSRRAPRLRRGGSGCC